MADRIAAIESALPRLIAVLAHAKCRKDIEELNAILASLSPPPAPDGSAETRQAADVVREAQDKHRAAEALERLRDHLADRPITVGGDALPAPAQPEPVGERCSCPAGAPEPVCDYCTNGPHRCGAYTVRGPTVQCLRQEGHDGDHPAVWVWFEDGEVVYDVVQNVESCSVPYLPASVAEGLLADLSEARGKLGDARAALRTAAGRLLKAATTYDDGVLREWADEAERAAGGGKDGE